MTNNSIVSDFYDFYDLNQYDKKELRDIHIFLNDILNNLFGVCEGNVYLKNNLLEYINSLFIIFLVCSGGIFLTAIIVAKLISFNYADDLDKNHNEYIDAMSKEYDEDYVFKYDELFEKSQEIYSDNTLSNNEKTELKNKFIREKTPKGEIIMSYNWETDIWLSSFQYYCNDSSIPYSYLESIAKLYVSNNKCPYFFLTNKKIKSEDEEIKDNTDIIENSASNVNTDEKNKNIDNEKSLFASFKSYNTVKNNINKNINNNTVSSINNKSQDDNVVLLKNRFTRVGTIEDYNQMIKKQELNNSKKTIPIGFSDYKNLHLNK